MHNFSYVNLKHLLSQKPFNHNLHLKSELTKHNLCIESTGNSSTFSKVLNLTSWCRSFNTNIATKKKNIIHSFYQFHINAVLLNFVFIWESWKIKCIMVSTTFPTLIIINVSWAANQHIRNISEGSCDTEDWSNDAENSALVIQIYYILQRIHIDNVDIITFNFKFKSYLTILPWLA